MQLVSAVAGGIALGAIYALVAAGLNLVFGVVKIINFAQGALLTVALYGVYVFYSLTGADPYWSLPVVVLVMGGIGYLIHRGLIDRVLRKERTSQLLITFGLGMALKYLCLAVFGPDHLGVATAMADRVVTLAGVRMTLASVIAAAGSALAVGFLYVFLHRTRIGTAIRAVAQQPDSAELAGIDVRRVYALAFAVGTALTGVAAALMAPIYTIQPDVGDTFGVMAFIVVILGGLGSVFGAATAALIIGIGQSVFATLVDVQMSTAFIFVLFIVLMIARPSGLFGRTARVA
ncbi:branched-chain amino acid ABC transporter permease [Mangrovihabitans endophyticus]|uniref:Branched-chain amino acid ABC transporter permease n=1 Tax=Mangrovihabitans endophyticus TaxID=1751298 RepID=A0A8J3C2L3_9ACTN|nr:branched-chain amino acid ABC transporter permease [Mangrovihabitans endophyticus]GGL09404.1 branched-chain amino acid ABC transporter permease [Mangrovihabitans endophyticus]